MGRLVRLYHDRVLNTCWRICGNRADAEDLTQEAFVKAFAAIDRFDGRSAFYTWLLRIAINLALSARRRRSAVPMKSLDGGERSDTDGAHRGPSLATDEPSPDRRAERRETQRIVLAALESLDEEHRTVIVLRDMDGLDYAEIAAVLDLPAGTVKSRIHRARMALREKLRPILDMRE